MNQNELKILLQLTQTMNSVEACSLLKTANPKFKLKHARKVKSVINYLNLSQSKKCYIKMKFKSVKTEGIKRARVWSVQLIGQHLTTPRNGDTKQRLPFVPHVLRWNNASTSPHFAFGTKLSFKHFWFSFKINFVEYFFKNYF